MKNAQVVLSATVVQNPEGAGLGRNPWNRQRGRDTAGRRGRWTGERSGYGWLEWSWDRHKVGITAGWSSGRQAYSRGLGGLGESIEQAEVGISGREQTEEPTGRHGGGHEDDWTPGRQRMEYLKTKDRQEYESRVPNNTGK